MVGRWSAGRRSHANDEALARITLLGLLGTASGPGCMPGSTNRAMAWIVLATYSGFNGFASVCALALYTRRMPTVQVLARTRARDWLCFDFALSQKAKK